MTIGQKIEAARIAANIPVYLVSNALNFESNRNYRMLLRGQYELSTYQKIMLVDLFANALSDRPELFICFVS